MSCREQKCAKNYNKWHSIYLFFKTAISICFRVLFDKIASLYFIWKIHLHFSIVNGQPREPVVSAHFRSLYHTCIATRGKSTASSCCLLLAVERCTERVLDSSSVSECPHNAAQSSHCKHLHIHSTLAISVTWPLTFSHTTHTHTPRSAGTRRNIHPLTPILVIRHPLSTSSIYCNPICVLDSPFLQPLSRSSVLTLQHGTEIGRKLMEDKNVSSTVWFPKLQQVSRNKATNKTQNAFSVRLLTSVLSFSFCLIFSMKTVSWLHFCQLKYAFQFP